MCRNIKKGRTDLWYILCNNCTVQYTYFLCEKTYYSTFNYKGLYEKTYYSTFNYKGLYEKTGIKYRGDPQILLIKIHKAKVSCDCPLEPHVHRTSTSLLQDTIFPFLLCHLSCCTDEAELAMWFAILTVSFVYISISQGDAALAMIFVILPVSLVYISISQGEAALAMPLVILPVSLVYSSTVI